MRIVGAIFSAALVVMVIIGWIAMPPELKALFTPFQLVTLLAVLVAIVGVIMSVAMSTVRADDDGIAFRNALRSHRFRWNQVERVTFGTGDPWPALVVNIGAESEDEDGTKKYVLLGILGSDGDRAVRAVQQLKSLHRAAR
jgi:hypothetical protein